MHQILQVDALSLAIFMHLAIWNGYIASYGDILIIRRHSAFMCSRRAVFTFSCIDVRFDAGVSMQIVESFVLQVMNAIIALTGLAVLLRMWI